MQMFQTKLAVSLSRLCFKRNCSNAVKKETVVKLKFKKFEPQKLTDPTPILIMHGMLGSSATWMSMSRTLSEQTGRVVMAVDARNHGRSPHSDVMSYEAMAQDHAALMRDLGVTSATLVGHSMGARTAMLMAMTEFQHLIRDLVVVDASPLHPTPPEGVRTSRAIFSAVSDSAVDADPTATKDEVRARVERCLEQRGMAKEKVKQWLLLNLEQRRPPESGFRWQFNASVISANFERRLLIVPTKPDRTAFPRRTLFVGGQKSNYISREHVDMTAVKRLFPMARFVSVEGAGHWVQADNPQRFAEVVVEFLNGESS